MSDEPDPPPAQGVEARPEVHHGPSVVHRPISEGDLDPDAVRTLKRLTRFDHTAYLVGGCVRDLLLDRSPKDFDIGTSATPRQIKRLFSNCRIIGRRFRLAHVYFQNGKILEVATFRARDVRDDDPEAAEDLLIRDDNVFGTPEEDAVRRDFTINQLFYDVNTGNVLDHADGLGDLRRRLVRTIGDPDVRFREDPIRILRAIKFAARLDFSIEAGTRAAIDRTRGEIPKAAPPRILEEINRFVRGRAGRPSFDLLFETGVFDVILPELVPAYRGNDAARALLARLLDAADARADATAISTGEIFTWLLLAPLHEALGWSADGTARPPRELGAVRDAVDDRLRPLALRLRMSRRDQERCRQTFLALQRMIPARDVRKGLRLAIVRRPAFPDAIHILEVLAAAHGGDFQEALTFWTSQSSHDGERRPPRPERAEPAARAAAPEVEREGEGEGAERGGRRRRRRRGGRGRGRTEGAPATPPREAPAEPAPSAALPPVWSDDYFFAALPSVPQLEAEAHDTDRYGAGAVAATAPAEPRPAAAAAAAAEEPRRRRRSRRGGRGRRRSGTGSGEPPPTDVS
ncbi:MAG TPA: CCA tRNA nucleotidyltransferase [Candidatus Polarisedimenticolaceae bacterium]